MQRSSWLLTNGARGSTVAVHFFGWGYQGPNTTTPDHRRPIFVFRFFPTPHPPAHEPSAPHCYGSYSSPDASQNGTSRASPPWPLPCGWRGGGLPLIRWTTGQFLHSSLTYLFPIPAPLWAAPTPLRRVHLCHQSLCPVLPVPLLSFWMKKTRDRKYYAPAATPI